MPLIDTHCHLDAAYFSGPGGPQDALVRARAAGVAAFMVIGVGATLEPARNAVALAESAPASMAAAVGVHPHDAAVFLGAEHGASALDEAAATELRALGAREAVAAIGEIGLDYHYDHSPREVQRDGVRAPRPARARAQEAHRRPHARGARATRSRSSTREGAREVGRHHPLLQRGRDVRASARSSSGSTCRSPGIVTFKNARAVAEVAASAPLDRILVETDSPYLAPVPMRGKPCEPAYVVHTAKRVAELRKMSLDDLSTALWKNAERRLRRTFTT